MFNYMYTEYLIIVIDAFNVIMTHMIVKRNIFLKFPRILQIDTYPTKSFPSRRGQTGRRVTRPGINDGYY